MRSCVACLLVVSLLTPIAARADQLPPDDPLPAPSGGAIVVDGAAMTIVCAAHFSEGAVLVAGPSIDAIRPTLDALAAADYVGIGVVLDGDTAAKQLTTAILAARRGEDMSAALPCASHASELHLKHVIAVGTAAQAIRYCDLGPFLFLEPTLDADTVGRFSGCAARAYAIDVIVTSCPAEANATTTLVDAARQQEDRPVVAQVPGCPDAPPGDAANAAVVSLLGNGRADETTDLVTAALPPPQTPRHTAYAVSTIAGFTVSGHAVLGLRAEVIALRRGYRSLGLGGHLWYGNAIGEPIDFRRDTGVAPVMLGAGVDAVIPLASGTHNPGDYDGALVVQPSLGVYVGSGTRIGGGAMLGLRMDHTALYSSELPFGVRVDAWYRLDTHKTDVSLSLTADGVGILAIAALVGSLVLIAANGSSVAR